MDKESLGKVYKEGEVIIRQGEVGNFVYIIQEGQAEVVVETAGQEVRLAVVGEGDFIGEMAVFDRDLRSATVRALRKTRVLTLDKKVFLSNFMRDPSLAFRFVETMSSRIRELDTEIIRLNEEMFRVKEIVNRL